MDPKERALLEAFELVPAEEIKKRLMLFQEALSRKGIQAALIFQNVDLFYFTGTLQRGFLVVPEQDEPLLFVQRDFERASFESPLRTVKVKGLSVIKDLQVLKTARTIGLEFDVIPVDLYLRLKGLLGEKKFLDISSDILYLRSKKSPFELKQMERAMEITEHMFSQAMSSIKPDMTEIELEAVLQAEARKRGHQGWLRMRGLNQEMCNVSVLSGPNGSTPSYVDGPLKGAGSCPAIGYGSTHKPLLSGEPIVIDCGGAHNGYCTDETRTFVIGSLPPRMKEAYKVSLEVLELFEKEAMAGKGVRELYRKAVELVESRGLSDHFMGYGEGQVKFVGHGIGLEINEWPVIADLDFELEEGMVFALEPKFVFPGQGAVGVEVDYVVEPRGIRRLGKFPVDLIEL